ncbi:MAG: flagellar export chaperone FliS [Deltaproteobacteria bacterium]|nr:flagellar export chaperone FliS [Deltaproteobacteria bacterium]
MNSVWLYDRLNGETESKIGLVVRAYDKVVELLNEAGEKIKVMDYEKKSELLSRAVEIITELMAALDFNQGKQIAVGLNNIYIYSLNRLLEADKQNNVDILKEISTIFEGLNEAWREVKREYLQSLNNKGNLSHVRIG